MRASICSTRRNFGLIVVIFAIAIYSGLLASEPLTPYLPENILRAHGVSLTTDGVMAALRSDDIEVRRAAADLLTERWPRLAVPVLEQVMSKEPEGFTRIWMATDLARLGDAAGRKFLRSECHNTTELVGVRMEAAADLTQEFDDYSCVDLIFVILKSETDRKDTLAKDRALELAPRLIGHVNPRDAYKLHELVFKSLVDPWPATRSSARIALAKIDAAITKQSRENGRKTP